MASAPTTQTERIEEFEAYSDLQLAEYIHRDIQAAGWNSKVRRAIAELDRRVNRS